MLLNPLLPVQHLCAANTVMRQLTSSSSAFASYFPPKNPCFSSLLRFSGRAANENPMIRSHTHCECNFLPTSPHICGELLGKNMRKAQNHYDLNAIKCVFSFRLGVLGPPKKKEGTPLLGYCLLNHKVSRKMSFLVDS